MDPKYVVILNSTKVDDLVNYIKDLKQQICPPLEYYVIYNQQYPTERDMNTLISLMHSLNNKKWRLKTPVDNQTPEALIDELFITRSIKHRLCVYIQSNITLDFSSRLKKMLEDDPDKWLYYLDSHQIFYSKLTEYLHFTKLREGLIALGHADKIH